MENADADWREVSTGLWDLLREAHEKRLWPVYLHGLTGRGKTAAAACVYRRWTGNRVQWFRLSDFVDLIQRCRKDGPQYVAGSSYAHGEPHFWRVKIEEPSLVIVDDVGVRSVTEIQREIITKLIDTRGKRPTIYTSNLSPKEIGQLYDARISSRINSGSPIEVTGRDRRFDGVQLKRA